MSTVLGFGGEEANETSNDKSGQPFGAADATNEARGDLNAPADGGFVGVNHEGNKEQLDASILAGVT